MYISLKFMLVGMNFFSFMSLTVKVYLLFIIKDKGSRLINTVLLILVISEYWCCINCPSVFRIFSAISEIYYKSTLSSQRCHQPAFSYATLPA